MGFVIDAFAVDVCVDVVVAIYRALSHVVVASAFSVGVVFHVMVHVLASIFAAVVDLCVLPLLLL